MVVGVVVDGVDGCWCMFVEEVVWECEDVGGVGEEGKLVCEEVEVAGE